MTRNDAGVRNSTASSGNESWKSSDTERPGSLFRKPSRSRTPIQVHTDRRDNFDESQISPTSGVPRSAALKHDTSPAEHRMKAFGNYRRDLAVLDTTGGHIPQIQHNPPTAASPTQIAPWMSSNGSPNVPSGVFQSSFFNDYDSSDNLSQASQLSPGFRPGTSRTGNTSTDSPDIGYFGDGDERRPSVASVTTASSSGSKSSIVRSGMHKSLKNIFGEEFNGKDGSDMNLPAQPRKEQRSNSWSRPRDRNHSTSTEAVPRDGSPAPSRPRTPVPSSEVVPFLYQDSQDISLYGEAPVREKLSGPDRERYITDDHQQFPPKTSSSGRSGHSQKHHLPRHQHNRSSDDTKSLRPAASRDNSFGLQKSKDRGLSSLKENSSRSKSPTPSGMSDWSQIVASSGHTPIHTSPAPSHKRNLINRFWGKKEKSDGNSLTLIHLSGSSRSLNKNEYKAEGSPDSTKWSREGSITTSDLTLPLPAIDNGQFGRPGNHRQGTFGKLPFVRKGRGVRTHGDSEHHIDQMDHNNSVSRGAFFTLDTDFSNMAGIIAHQLPLTPLDSKIFAGNVDDEAKPKPDSERNSGVPEWNAPDSWAVKKVNDENFARLPAEAGVPRKADEKSYCIRIFRSDGTFATLSMNLDAPVNEAISQLGRKSYVTEPLESYQIIMKKHDLQRVLGSSERPVVIQKRLLEQAGYEERDRIEDVGREDNSYLCRFLFVSAHESGYAAISQELGFSKTQKFSHVDLSDRNLITIPIALYGKASEIISLNLSRNLSLNLPRDFIQSCVNLRDIKYMSNEAWNLPPSLSRASRLTILDVSNNRLEELEHAELNRLQGLISLKLANNRLTHLPLYFGAFTSMRTLNVSSNFLSDFPSFLCDLEGLVDLDMSFNAIGTIPDEIGKLRALDRFVITNNRLSGSLPETFSLLRNLREVDIRYNALSSIDIIAALPNVEQISADHNTISVFEGTFEKIRVLRLNSNPVTRFEILNYVPTLTTLILSNAKLAYIPDAAFNKMPNLVKLVLDKNLFVSLPHHIGKLRKLEHFSIADNTLSSLPPEIGCLSELRFLDVRQNNLKKLPMEIWWASKLETLNISTNILSDFPKPGSRPPQVPEESPTISERERNGGTPAQTLSITQNHNFEEPGPLEAFNQRRPSQASSSYLNANNYSPSTTSDRKASVVSAYGRGGRKTSVVSRTGSQSTLGTQTPPLSMRKDSSISARLVNTFASSLRNLCLADNQLDDDVFDEITLLSELRVLNLSYNDISDIPQRSLRSWPQLVELYLSGNELSSLPSDDFEAFSHLQVLHINGNKFQTLPAEFSKAKRLAILDCGSNSLKYNVSNWPYDWNWNFNPNLKYLNLSGNKRLEIKPNVSAFTSTAGREDRALTDFSALEHLRVLGLMDVTLTIPTIPDETEDRRVRTSGSLAGALTYGMADSLGRNEHLSTIDMVVPRFNSNESEILLGMFDGQALSSGGSKIAKYLHENFGKNFADELRKLNIALEETPVDALRRSFLSLNKDLATAAIQHTEERLLHSHRGSAAPAVLTQADLNSGGVATIMFIQQMELYVANVGDAQAMLIHSESTGTPYHILTRKHDPAEPNERQRIRDAGGWVSRQGKLNDVLEVSRAFGYVQLMPAVQAAPHIIHVTLKETDEMIVIASRELWEYLPPDLVVDVARSERNDLMRGAQKLRDFAMAFGATGKIMVMMVGVSDLKKRERARLNRGTSMSFGPTGIPDDAYLPNKRVRRAKGEDVEDSTLRRLKAEVEAPIGDISIVFTDIKGSTLLWETHSAAMRAAIKMHNDVMRRQLRLIGGYEVKTEGDAFMVSFPTAPSALLWAFAVQSQLLEVQWPAEVLNSSVGKEVFDNDGNLIYRGLSVRMGIHWGNPLCETDPVTRRMDYFGPMVNKTSRISSVADGGQITVSHDFITEIQRCWEAFPDSDRSGSIGSDEPFENDLYAQTIRRELNNLSLQGYEMKDMGERKLKGLENPEFIYLMYPHSLAGRIYHQPCLQTDTDASVKPSPGHRVVDLINRELNLSITIDLSIIFELWSVTQRLEMLCSGFEETSATSLQSPAHEMLETMRAGEGEVTDEILLNFMKQQVTRIENTIASLYLRKLVLDTKNLPLEQLWQSCQPMDQVFADLSGQLAQLRAYKRKFGDICEDEADISPLMASGPV